MHLFIELFPVEAALSLTAYALHFADTTADRARVGSRLAARMRRSFPSAWLWLDEHLVTDTERSAVELMITLDILKGERPELFGVVEQLEQDHSWKPSPQHVAEFALKALLNPLEKQLESALSRFNGKLEAVRVEREYKFTPWTVGGLPTIGITVAGKLIYEGNAQTFATSQPEPAAALIGLRVTDSITGITGEISGISGSVGARRPKLLQHTRNDQLYQLIETAPDQEYAVRVKAGSRKLEYPARALDVLVHPSDFSLFDLEEKQVNTALRPDPFTRSQYVKALADVAKEAGILGKAYNSRENPTFFTLPEFEPYLRFDNKRTRPYKPATLSNDFLQCGAYHLRNLYREQPIRVCVVNALPQPLEDFLEAMQRQLKRTFAFTLDVMRERRVRVVSLSNLESAIKVAEKESPDIILAFIPEGSAEDGTDDTELSAFVKSLTLGRGIPAHVIYGSTLDEPEAMGALLMAILAKTGNTPFALADPLEFADFVVGLDLVRKPNKIGDSTHITAIARIYRSNGEFVRYAVGDAEISGDTLPFVLMRDLFPQRDFAQKRVVVHHDGRLPDDTRQALTLWARAISAAFCPVEIVRRGAPRLYAFDEGKVQAPPWGSVFHIEDQQALLVLASDQDQPTPQPLHLIATGLNVRQAILSIQLWTLLYYGVIDQPKVPITVHNAGELAYWLEKGGKFSAAEGEVPFWL